MTPTSSRTHPPRRLDVLHRSKVRLPPCRDPPLLLEILGILVRRRLLFLHIAPVRACHCPVRLHTTYQTTGKAMVGKRRAGCSICRRLTVPLQLPLGCTLDLRSCCSGPEDIRFCYKRQKVTSTSLTPDSFPRPGD
ncbi:hypothetical protein CLOM_g19898 [Closterium sp. NIES-68]|nr:hypothetical protein CLOM_g19898 [Closterium sp. NIES-68]